MLLTALRLGRPVEVLKWGSSFSRLRIITNVGSSHVIVHSIIYKEFNRSWNPTLWI